MSERERESLCVLSLSTIVSRYTSWSLAMLLSLSLSSPNQTAEVVGVVWYGEKGGPLRMTE